MAKTQGSIIELTDKNLRAWRSHFSFREEFSFIYAKICKKQKGERCQFYIVAVDRLRPCAIS